VDIGTTGAQYRKFGRHGVGDRVDDLGNGAAH